MRPASTALITAFALSFSALVGIIGVTDVTLRAQNPGGSPEGKKMVNPTKATPDSLEAGKTVFLRTCRGCHGETGKGDGPSAKFLKTPPSDLSDAKWDRGATDGELFLVIRNGVETVVYVAADKGTFIRREVQVGHSIGGRVSKLR